MALAKREPVVVWACCLGGAVSRASAKMMGSASHGMMLPDRIDPSPQLAQAWPRLRQACGWRGDNFARLPPAAGMALQSLVRKNFYYNRFEGMGLQNSHKTFSGSLPPADRLSFEPRGPRYRPICNSLRRSLDQTNSRAI
jgi:hypothetical protein